MQLLLLLLQLLLLLRLQVCLLLLLLLRLRLQLRVLLLLLRPAVNVLDERRGWRGFGGPFGVEGDRRAWWRRCRGRRLLRLGVRGFAPSRP